MSDSVKYQDPQNARNLAQRLSDVTGRLGDLSGMADQYKTLGASLGSRLGGPVKALEDQGQMKAFGSQVDNITSQVRDVLAPRLSEWGTQTIKGIDAAVSATDEGAKNL